MRGVVLGVLAASLSGCALIPPAPVPPLCPSGQAVVTDIDGTLTPKDLDVFEPRPNAAEALRAFSEKGYTIIYVTTRIPLFQSGLPGWLYQNGFPISNLHVAQTEEERANPAAYKFRVLNQYRQAGWRLAYAYGDSESDFIAYAKVEIPRDRVFALKRRCANECQPGIYRSCLEGWSEHLPYIASEVAKARRGLTCR